MGDKDRKAKPVVSGQGVIEIHLLDNNKQFNVTQRLAALCMADSHSALMESVGLGSDYFLKYCRFSGLSGIHLLLKCSDLINTAQAMDMSNLLNLCCLQM